MSLLLRACPNTHQTRPRWITSHEKVHRGKPGDHLVITRIEMDADCPAQLPGSVRPSVAWPLPAESLACSNQIWISVTRTCSSLPKQIAERSIHRSRSRRPRGRQAASSIGG